VRPISAGRRQSADRRRSWSATAGTYRWRAIPTPGSGRRSPSFPGTGWRSRQSVPTMAAGPAPATAPRAGRTSATVGEVTLRVLPTPHPHSRVVVRYALDGTEPTAASPAPAGDSEADHHDPRRGVRHRQPEAAFTVRERPLRAAGHRTKRSTSVTCPSGSRWRTSWQQGLFNLIGYPVSRFSPPWESRLGNKLWPGTIA